MLSSLFQTLTVSPTSRKTVNIKANFLTPYYKPIFLKSYWKRLGTEDNLSIQIKKLTTFMKYENKISVVDEW